MGTYSCVKILQGYVVRERLGTIEPGYRGIAATLVLLPLSEGMQTDLIFPL